MGARPFTGILKFNQNDDYIEKNEKKLGRIKLEAGYQKKGQKDWISITNLTKTKKKQLFLNS